MLYLILLCILNFLTTCFCSQEVNIGAVFENDEALEKVFNFAVDTVNKQGLISDFTFKPLVQNNLTVSDSYYVMRNVCSILEEGVVAIFGPRSFENIAVVQSICDNKEIPHIVTRWNNLLDRDSIIVNFYPHPSSLTGVYYDIILSKGWKTFTILYEDNESLIRLQKLIESVQEKEIVIQLLQLDQFGYGNYRTTMRTLKKTGQQYILIDCNIDILFEVLSQLQQAGLMNDNYNYFITNLDAHTENLLPFKYSGSDITGIRLINPEKEYVRQTTIDLFADDFIEATSWKLRVEHALIIDAIHMYTKVFSDRQKSSTLEIVGETNNSLPCDEPNSWEHGLSIVNLLKTQPFEGLTGKIVFDNEGYRSDFDLIVYELLEGGITDIGSWRPTTGLNISRPGDITYLDNPESLKNRSFIVQITLTEPYGMLKQTTEHMYGNSMYEGYAIDLIEELAKMEGFNYTFIVREDKNNGGYNKTTGKGSGMIGDLLEYKSDLAICDFTITSDRAEAIDFTVPFMNLGISILFKKPKNAPPSFFSFADPFGLDTWLALGVSFFVVSVAFYFMGRLCADEWTNPFPCIEEPEYLVNQFSLNNSLWFATGAILAQGSEIAPIAISTRMASGMWWYFCLIMSASYTANLAAFLATENPISLFTDLESLYNNEHGIVYGAKNNGATLRYFISAEEGTLLKKVGQRMIENPQNVKENDEGVRKAEQENYAFFMESSSIDYVTQRHCSLKQYGDLIDHKGYGIAMRKNSPYRKRLSLALLKLQQNHFLDDLKKKWWEDRRGGGACGGDEPPPEANPLGIANVGGCFMMTTYGTILAVILVIIEHWIYLVKLWRKSKLPFVQLLKDEFKAYLNFNENTKPNLMIEKEKSESGSEEENKSEVDKKTNSEKGSGKTTKSKSASKLQSFTKSRSRSNSRSRGKSLSNSKKSPIAYGFILPSSLENFGSEI